jgi:hypothetical protein
MDEHIRKNILFVMFWLIVLKVNIYIYIYIYKYIYIFIYHQWILLICPRLLIKFLRCWMPIVKRIEEEIFVQIITNNAANYKTTRQLLMEKRKMMFWTPYAGHCIDSKLEYF